MGTAFIFWHLYHSKPQNTSMVTRLAFAFIIIAFFGSFTQPGIDSTGVKLLPPYYQVNQDWVEEKLAELSLEEKIGQLMMVAAYSNRDAAHVKSLETLVVEHKIGGLMFLQGGPARQAKITNQLQNLAETPLLIALDAEWGLSMRLDSTFKYPWPITMGAMTADSLVYKMGYQIGEQLRRIGVHMNFAPVVDINSNPLNPIINARAFGEDKYRVSDHALAYMHGLQNAGVLACAKHFPGHGDTETDSHKELPQVNHDKARIDSIDIYPFKQLISEGLAAVMTAHLELPKIDSVKNRASSVSEKVVQGWLKEELHFKGLAITDALNMKGVSDYYEPGELELEALLAGNDILLFAEDVPKAIQLIKKAVRKKKILETEIDARVRKVLMTKKWLGLDTVKTVEPSALSQDLNKAENKVLEAQIFEESITLLQNNYRTLPLRRLDTLEIAYLPLGPGDHDEFFNKLNKYLPVKMITPAMMKNQGKLRKELAYTNFIVVGYHTNPASPWKSYKLDERTLLAINSIAELNKTWAFVQFANPYAALGHDVLNRAQVHVLAYQNDSAMQSTAAQAIFGSLSFKGKAPVSAKPVFRVGDGLQTYKLGRLGYKPLEGFGIESKLLKPIDSIVADAIEKEATPGAQVLVAYKGNVVFQKSYGYHTYNKLKEVEDHHLYDLASITKIGATLPCVIDLAGQSKLSLDDPLGKVNPSLTGTNKYSLPLREVLAHTAGLPSWIPFYRNTVDRGKLRADLYSTIQDVEYPYEVAGGIFIQRNFVDSMFQQIYTIDLGPKKYKYSDLGYYLIGDGLSKTVEPNLEYYLQEKFYQPLGAYTMGYHPRKRFYLEQIVPTEYDTYFRNQLVHGYVHDPGAAMMGGVAGHAGLFSSANDLAKLGQMYLQKGYYGGLQFFDPVVFESFTEYQFPRSDNRRGAGFDKPVQKGEGGPACKYASPSSFGHSGFTGTLMWIDPEYDLVYIFLSNRVYPRGDNFKLVSMDVRTKIQEVVYETIINSNNQTAKR